MKKTNMVITTFAVVAGACAQADETDEPPQHDQEDVQGVEQAIYGGTSAGDAAFDAVVTVVNTSGLCTGTLISPTLVYTAAHCFDKIPLGSPTTVWFGGHAVSAQTLSWHPRTNHASLEGEHALIRLNTPVNFVTPREFSISYPGVNDSHTLVGFGGDGKNCSTHTGTRNQTTLSVTRVVGASANILQYENDSSYSCPGDSGGPSFDDSGRIVGLSAATNATNYSNYNTAFDSLTWLAAQMYGGHLGFGSSAAFVAGTYSLAQGGNVLNDAISSMIIAPGYTVHAWAEDGWGDSATFSGTVALSDHPLNDRISRLEVLPGATLYEHANFTGISQTFPAGSYDVGALNSLGNDKVSSLAVSPEMEVYVCTHAGLVGPCTVYRDRVPFVGSLNDQISSFVVRNRMPDFSGMQQGTLRDVGVGANDVAWGISDTPSAGGFRIVRYDGRNWVDSVPSNGAAVRVAVQSNGVPWVVNDGGHIFRRTTNVAESGGWEHMTPGACARDIGVGANDEVWVVGCDPAPGGFNVYKYTGSGWDYVRVPTGATRIAVGPDGKPWAVNSANHIFRGTSNNPFTLGWEHVPGLASDISVSANGIPWIVGSDQPALGDGPDFHVYYWNQPLTGANSWSQATSYFSATTIAVGNGVLFTVDSLLRNQRSTGF